MEIDWELREAGPRNAESTVLLLPGGMCSAGSYAEVMAQSALAAMRLIAATMPGHAGAPPPDDYSVENYARVTAELATSVGANVIVGFSMSASVVLDYETPGMGGLVCCDPIPDFFRAMRARIAAFSPAWWRPPAAALRWRPAEKANQRAKLTLAPVGNDRCRRSGRPRPTTPTASRSSTRMTACGTPATT